MTYQELKRALTSRPDVRKGEGATEAEILAVEDVIGPIPEEYREFLADFGWVRVRHYELFGVGAGITSRNDLVRETQYERNSGRVQGLVPIMNDGTGNLYCVRQSVAESSAATPVILSTLDSDPDYVVDRNGFSSWFLELIDDSGA